MRVWKSCISFVWTALACLAIAGCVTPTFRTQVTAFNEWPAGLNNSTYAFERTPQQANDLEYRNYENLVREELQRLGFAGVEDPKSAQLKASLTYEIKVRDVRVSEPVVIDPYWPGPYRYGPYGSYWPGYYSPYYGPFYDPFWYGPPIVERRDSSFQVFTRKLRIVLARASDGKNLYDVTVVSEGGNGTLAAVMPYMVRAAFQDFPGPSGVPRVVEFKMQ